MRILILNQFFYPDAAATAQLLTDLARSLGEQGHSVRVICGRSSYANKPGATIAAIPGVETVHTQTVPFARTRPGRVASYFSYIIRAAWHSLFSSRPDLVLTLTTPPGLCLVGSLLKLVKDCRHFIWEMDVYPDIAVELNVMRRHSPVTKLVGACLDHSRRYADGVIALSKAMRERLVRHGIAPERIQVAENWADGREIQPRPFPEWQPLRILYSGNFGLAHDAGTIRGAIERLAGDPRVHFTFGGAGSQRTALELLQQSREIPNLEFHDYCSRQKLSESLGNCHIGLVTQKPQTLGAVVPSKIYGIMAAGRAVLFIGPKSANPAVMIQQHGCGWQIDPGDIAGLTALLETLAAHPAEVAEAGRRAREAFLKYYDAPFALRRICSILGVEEPVPDIDAPPETATLLGANGSIELKSAAVAGRLEG